MSPKGTQPTKVAGSQLVLKPWEANPFRICCARPTQSEVAPIAPAIEGFRPPGRKKFIREESTATGAPEGVNTHPTVNGLAGGVWPVASAYPYADMKFATIKSPRMVLALIGRFRWRPPLKLYARLSA